MAAIASGKHWVRQQGSARQIFRGLERQRLYSRWQFHNAAIFQAVESVHNFNAAILHRIKQTVDLT